MPTELHVLVENIYGAECPRMRDGRLWFTDLFGRKVMSVALDGEDLRTEFPIDDRPQAIGWLPGGDILVLAMDSRRILRRWPDGVLRTHAELGDIAGGPCSGMLVDPVGRAYVGNFGFDLEGAIATGGRDSVMRLERPRARLACVSPDGEAREAAGDFDVLCNAPVITPDGTTMIVGEMFGSRLVAFDRAADGALSNRRVWAELGPRRPDALALDAEGAIWFTHPSGAECVRVAKGGEILDVIDIGVSCFGCGLGGIDGRTLFITTMPSATPGVAELAARGQILAIDVEVPHAGWP